MPDKHNLQNTVAEKRILSSKESEVVAQIAKGKSRKEIAHALGIASGTLNSHFKNIFLKLGTRSVSETIIWALKNGYS